MQWKEWAVVEVARTVRLATSSERHLLRPCVLLATAGIVIALTLWSRGLDA